jgi:hypothetical protein
VSRDEAGREENPVALADVDCVIAYGSRAAVDCRDSSHWIFWECLRKRIGCPFSLRLEDFNGKTRDFRPIFAESLV